MSSQLPTWLPSAALSPNLTCRTACPRRLYSENKGISCPRRAGWRLGLVPRDASLGLFVSGIPQSWRLEGVKDSLVGPEQLGVPFCCGESSSMLKPQTRNTARAESSTLPLTQGFLPVCPWLFSSKTTSSTFLLCAPNPLPLP